MAELAEELKSYKQENAELGKALDKAIKLIVKAAEYHKGTCILGDGDCPVANGLCTTINDKYNCLQEECWREYFTKDNGGDNND